MYERMCSKILTFIFKIKMCHDCYETKLYSIYSKLVSKRSVTL